MTPEAVTVYQMEIPYNTTVYQRMKDGGEHIAPVADWQTKRRWVADAFAAFEVDGYRVGSALLPRRPSSPDLRTNASER